MTNLFHFARAAEGENLFVKEGVQHTMQIAMRDSCQRKMLQPHVVLLGGEGRICVTQCAKEGQAQWQQSYRSLSAPHC
jgi:hypothetical protein